MKSAQEKLEEDRDSFKMLIGTDLDKIYAAAIE